MLLINFLGKKQKQLPLLQVKYLKGSHIFHNQKSKICWEIPNEYLC